MAGLNTGLFDSSLKGKVVLLVSAAQDLGYDLAAPLEERGFRIVLAGNLPQVQAAASHIRALKTKANMLDGLREVEMDVRGGEASIDAAVDQAWETFGTIDVVIYCSAVPGALKSPLDHDESDWDETLVVNLKTPWLIARAVAQRMKLAERPGSIVFVSYITGLERGFYPGVSLHGTAMAGLHQLTKFMGMELGKYGVTVAAIARGLSKTDPLLGSSSEQQLLETGKKVVPLQRWMHPVLDLEALTLFLASDHAKYSTSNIFIVDGGQSLSRPRMKSYL